MADASEGAAGWRDGDTRLTTTTDDDTAPSSAVVPALTVLAHPDARRIGDRIALPVLAVGREVKLSRLEPAFQPPAVTTEGATTEGEPLAERSISRQPIRLRGSRGGGVFVDGAETRTRLVVDGETVDATREINAEAVDRGAVLQVGRHVVLLLHRVALPFPGDVRRFGLVGESDAVVRLCQELERLAPLDVSVLLRGESGTGKELAARALHDGGPRSRGPFVAVNMATLSPSLAAAELFGAERGAYTGAERKKKGFFQGAEGGTLFLDEIAETPVEVQAMLLRALENGEVLPVGSVDAQPVDVRVIAATDARLEEAMTEGRFRTPLYHRLAGYAVQLPPLRERLDDLGRLLRFFLDDELAKLGGDALNDGERSWPPAEVVARLARHDWTGNVRELRNVARRLTITGRDSDASRLLASIESLLAPPSEDEAAAPAIASATAVRPTRPSEIGEEALASALRANRWSVQATAEALGISRAGLYKRMDQSPTVRKATEIGHEEIATASERCGGDLDAMVDVLQVSKSALRRRMRQLGLE